MNFDPNGVGINNGNFIGLPFDEESAKIILLPVPWDVTTSYAPGTSNGPENIRFASLQLDLYDLDAPNAWKDGIFMQQQAPRIKELNNNLRPLALQIIDAWETGKNPLENKQMKDLLDIVNKGSEEINHWVYTSCLKLLEDGKKIGLIGGEHSVPLGYYKALATKYEDFGILQIDAHCDLRNQYEGFQYSHASIMANALKIPNITKLVQVGIRDFCQEEMDCIDHSNGRIVPYFDEKIKQKQFKGVQFHSICEEIIQQLPQHVHISFDIDGLDPKLCPDTGTPVPGGLDWSEAIYLLRLLKKSGKTIIGFDVCEVAGDSEWDGNVGARLIYKLCTILA